MEIRDVLREPLPAVKLVGRRYGNGDRDEHGTFGRYWGEAFESGYLERLLEGKAAPGATGDYIGGMRGQDGAFEYWIGVFLAPDAQVPEGFQAADIPAGELGVCYLYGNEASGELYGPEAAELCRAAFAARGWTPAPGAWYFERYNCPRFTTPDEAGNVILDICALIG